MYPQQNQVQNKPTAAYVLSLLGGIIGLPSIARTHSTRRVSIHSSRFLLWLLLRLRCIWRIGLGLDNLHRLRCMDAHNLNTHHRLCRQTQIQSTRTQQMGRTHPHILNHRRWRTTRLNRRHTGARLQTYSGWSGSTICASTTLLWTTTPTGSLPATTTTIRPTTTHHTYLPTMR